MSPTAHANTGCLTTTCITRWPWPCRPCRRCGGATRTGCWLSAGPVGALLEIVVLDPDTEPVIIHAMPLRAKFYRFLEKG